MLIIKQIGGITYNTIDLVGESGIGKSALLDEIYRRLSEQEEGQINPALYRLLQQKSVLIL